MIWWARAVVGFGVLCFVASFVVLAACVASDVVEWIVPRIMEHRNERWGR